MTDRRAYNLHSGGSEAVIPVQFEVSDDRFFSSLVQSQQNTSKTGQVSDSDSGSESNESMSNNESDTERLGASESTGVDKQVPSSSSGSNTSSCGVVSQQEINLQILAQLGICLFGVLRRFQHCTGHITTGSWKGRGNQYI